VIIDLTAAEKQQSVLDRYIKPEHRRKTFERAIRGPQNFLKTREERSRRHLRIHSEPS